MARLEPFGRVIRVGAPESSVVERLLVHEGTEVAAGEILVHLRGHSVFEAECDAARLRVERLKLQVYELEMQQARLHVAEADLAHAAQDLERQKELADQGLSSKTDYDQSLLRQRHAEQELTMLQASLRQLQKSQPMSQLEAENDLKLATARLEQALIRAPMNGRILKILAQAGERAGPGGILQMGDTRQMGAVAEVHANDIRWIRPGQRAVFSSAALGTDLEGTVEEVGGLIYKNDVFGEDPTAPENVRVVQVRIRLMPVDSAGGLTNLEGQVRIVLKSSASRDQMMGR